MTMLPIDREGGGMGPEDRELICRLRSRDEAALDVVMRKYSFRVTSAAFQILRRRCDAEEVTQDVFMSLWRSPERFDSDRGALPTWLIILARSRALDRLRRIQAKSRRENRVKGKILGLGAAAAEAFTRDRNLTLQQLLSRLPAQQERVIRRAYFEGYALAEIAALHRIPLGTVKGRVRFAMKKLRAELLTTHA
jgi:RNA polymerase sigma-70 factor, ECF subfamily